MAASLSHALAAIAGCSLAGSAKKALVYHAVIATLRPSESPKALSDALAAREAALAVGRKVLGVSGGAGEVANALRARGEASLANRVRASARSRNALAHPDLCLAASLAELGGRFSGT